LSDDTVCASLPIATTEDGGFATFLVSIKTIEQEEHIEENWLLDTLEYIYFKISWMIITGIIAWDRENN